VEEDSLAAAYKLGLSGWRVGIGSLAVVVHPSNPVRQIALDQLREIFQGQMSTWGRLGGQDGPIRTIWREPNSASYQLIVEKVMAGMLPKAPDAWAYSDSETLERVARDPSAVGILSTSSASPKVKVLAVAVARGFPYYLPSLENLWNQKYPLRHYDVLVYRNPGPPLADGIATYMLSNEGQRVARDAGVVPTAVPVKINRAAP
jgi:phosphate transport system substrate-binding protein